MKMKFILLLLIIFFVLVMDSRPDLINIRITKYVIPAITETKYLPNSNILSDYLSNQISVTGCPGEYVPVTFIIKAETAINSLLISASNLVGNSGTITACNLDIRVVKSWFQAGYRDIRSNNIRGVTPVLVPELLLHDDSLIKVIEGENYVKFTNDSYRWISQKVADTSNIPTVSSFPVKDDSSNIQPVTIPAGTNKQFWITIHVPSNSIAGTYQGIITLGETSSIKISLVVLPFSLAPSNMTQSIYYYGLLSNGWNGGVGSIGYIKNHMQLKAELDDMKSHGITNPAIFQQWRSPDLGTFMQYFRASGFTDNSIYYVGLGPQGMQNPSTVGSVLSYMNYYGINSVYFYGKDEAIGSTLINQRDSWTAIRNAGGKIFVSGYAASQFPPGNFEEMGDIQDLQIQCDYYNNLTIAQRQTEAAKWHSRGHKIFSYDNPQMGLELPLTYRRNFGLMLWQVNYDGAMNYIYQSDYGNVWNDWDDPGNNYKDHNMTYPTSNGVLDTLQWEGYAAGITDLRYMATLQAAITAAKANGKDTASAENWLTILKNSNLETQDMDAIRTQMISFILNLRGIN
jgi:hypothetical protein